MSANLSPRCRLLDAVRWLWSWRDAGRPRGFAASRMTHGQAVSAMIVVTLLWRMAGIVTRRLRSTGSFEATFWRSAFTVTPPR